MIPFEDIFRYQYETNKKVLIELEGYDEVLPPKARQLFCHMINAHHIWNARILNEPSTLGVLDQYDFQTCTKFIEKNHVQTASILGSKNLEDSIHYTTSKGESFSNSIQQILFHVNNHHTHHRAQIMSLFRHHGVPPLVTDYIFYARK